MKPETRRKVDFLYGGPMNHTTMTNKEVEDVIDEVGTDIIVAGRLRTINFKRIIGSRYRVSTTLFTK